MKLMTSVAVSAAGAWLAGTATAVVGLAALQSRLPALMTHGLRAEPDLQRPLVLLGTGECTAEDHRAEELRARLEATRGRPVVYVDLTVRPGTSARQAARTRELAHDFHADVVLDHDDESGAGPAGPVTRRWSSPEAAQSRPAGRTPRG